MRATLDWGATNWSYDLLSEPEKDLFARLSVFAGGFDLEPAETVGENRESDEEDVLLGSPSSWRNPARGGGGLRYRMLEPVRQYARKRLDEGGEEYETGRRHAAYCLSLAERARPKLQGREGG
jgi:predicted ATPase